MAPYLVRRDVCDHGRCYVGGMLTYNVEMRMRNGH